MTLSTKYGRWDGMYLLTNSGDLFDFHGFFASDFHADGETMTAVRRYLMEKKKDELALESISFKPNGLDVQMVVKYDTGRVESHSLEELLMRAASTAHAKNGATEEMGFNLFYPPIPDLNSINILPYVADLLKL